MLFFTCIKLVARVLACARAIARIRWRRLLSLPRNLAVGTFGELLIVFSTKVNLLYLLYLTAQRCCLLLLKTTPAKLFAQNLSKNSNLDDSGISLPVFPSRTNLKLHIFTSVHHIHHLRQSFSLSTCAQLFQLY